MLHFTAAQTCWCALLQDVVGIKNKGHISQIVTYLCQPSALASAASGLPDAAQQGQQPGSFMADLDSFVQQAAKVTLSVEGNISAGKSTFLRMLRESIRDEDMRVGAGEGWSGIDVGACVCICEAAGRDAAAVCKATAESQVPHTLMRNLYCKAHSTAWQAALPASDAPSHPVIL